MSRLAAARAVGIEVAARHADDVDAKARFPREAIAALKEAKLLGLLIPQSLGGPGAGIAEMVAICHELGRHCASTAMIYAMHQIQVSCIARHAGNSPWHGAFMGRLAGEQLLLASATSEAASAATYARACAQSSSATTVCPSSRWRQSFPTVPTATAYW